MAEKHFEHTKEGKLISIITLYYKDPGVRDCAFSAYYIKTKKSFKVYCPIYKKDIKPLKIFKKEESAIKFCKKTLEEKLEKRIGKLV